MTDETLMLKERQCRALSEIVGKQTALIEEQKQVIKELSNAVTSYQNTIDIYEDILRRVI